IESLVARFLETGDLTAQQRLDLVLEAAQLGVWEADLRTGELRISERLAAMYGLPASATNPPRDVWRDRIHPEDRDRVEEAFRATLGGGRDYAAEYRAFDHEGRTRWLASRATIVRDVAGRLLRAIGVVSDITERRRAEESHAHAAAIVDSSDDAIVGKTLAGIITSWNKGAERIFGYSAEEMVGQPIAHIVPPDRPDDVPTILATIGRGERVELAESLYEEETGRISGCDVSHPELFLRFGAAVGVPREAMVDGVPLPATAALIDWFERSTKVHSFIEGAAATNLAAEGQV